MRDGRINSVAFVYDAVYPYVSGGVEKRIWELARRLARKGIEVHLFGVKFWAGDDTVSRQGVTLHGVCRPRPFYTSSGRRSIIQALSFAAALPARLAGRRFDVIDCQASTPLACLAVWPLARVRGIPLIITWHEVWDDYWLRYLGLLGYLARLIERACKKLTQYHLSVSRHTADRMKKYLGIDHVILVRNGTDVSLANQAEPSSQTSDLVFVGRLVRQKNVDLLLEALSELRRRDLNPRLLVVGDGPERRCLEERAKRLGLDEVLFHTDLGSEEEVLGAMKASRLFVLPSTHEGFGLAALEAMACGLPVVAVDAPGSAVGEFVGDAGLMVANDPIDFANAVEKLLTDEPARRRMSIQASNRANTWDWEAVVAKLEMTYCDVVDMHRR